MPPMKVQPSLTALSTMPRLSLVTPKTTPTASSVTVQRPPKPLEMITPLDQATTGGTGLTQPSGSESSTLLMLSGGLSGDGSFTLKPTPPMTTLEKLAGQLVQHSMPFLLLGSGTTLTTPPLATPPLPTSSSGSSTCSSRFPA